MGLRNRKEFLDQDCFFITTNCHEHKFLLLEREIFDILIENFNFYNKKYKADLCAYVLMNNHIHFIIYFHEINNLSNYMRDFKKYTSLKIREYIQNSDIERLIDLKYESRSQHFKIWDDGFDDVVLYSKKVCESKIEYIHQNPVVAKMCENPEEYRYSSAGFYLGKANNIIKVLDYCEVF